MEVKNLRRSESSNSMPSLISRLDHLDSAINDLESKKWSSARWRIVAGDVKRECVPLDWAIKEAQSKGSILDRITSLEERLNKLCLDMEPEAESPPSKISQVEQEADSPSISRARIFSNSFSRFRLLHRHHNHKQPISQVCINKFQVTKKKEQHLKASPNNEGSHNQGKNNKNAKASPKQNKKVLPSSLLHSKLLGC